MTSVMQGSPAHAALFASERHAGQKRKGLDEPYWNHCRRVANMAREFGLSDDAVAAAYLHDVVEDTSTTVADLQAAGFSDRTVVLVHLLTKWWPDGTPDVLVKANKRLYYSRIVADPDATVLKLLDRTDNLRDMLKVVKTHRPWAARYAQKTVNEFALLSAACPRISVVGNYLQALRDVGDALVD